VVVHEVLPNLVKLVMVKVDLVMVQLVPLGKEVNTIHSLVVILFLENVKIYKMLEWILILRM
jgi:hypothetical protein